MRFTAESVFFFFFSFSSTFSGFGRGCDGDEGDKHCAHAYGFSNIRISSDSHVTACALFITFILHKWKLLSRNARARLVRTQMNVKDEKTRKCQKKKKKKRIGRRWSVFNESDWDRSLARRPQAHLSQTKQTNIGDDDDNNKHKHNNNSKNKIIRCATKFTILIFICAVLNDHCASLTKSVQRQCQTQMRFDSEIWSELFASHITFGSVASTQLMSIINNNQKFAVSSRHKDREDPATLIGSIGVAPTNQSGII